ncbi:hypothetical protein B0I00_1640 [Novosphingobium kunmingense]|uniref:DUF192 domain-containing protein n=1 Tax=Novosphingobium kunmingense TaxID=1211806 RepID=A0A2N0HKL1_9SPHN|nr:DUF192 domain-containing protein [Novosphingobium kunmingense]PKB19408.1 hypothetical protein B0I00_1640 [Novosphingobium kunmingense]
MSRAFVTALVLTAAACSPSSGDAAPQSTQAAVAVHPVSGLPVIALTVTHAGTVRGFRVEVASTSQEQARGLMFRTEMGADEGMIFPMNPPRTASFWMRNTVIPLDMIFVGTDGRILNIRTAQPYDETPQPSAGVVKAVLELNGGRARQLGIEPGDRVDW